MFPPESPCIALKDWIIIEQLTFKNRASYIKDGRTATLQMLHFIYIFFNKYKYSVF